ncbi:MAG: Eco57I restriction-modification methylase domain-containing protein [Zavarzinia sp.]|nr:Eco57I restriction-modification methylase domain-containing protein [Zavarzinia sp.]
MSASFQHLAPPAPCPISEAVELLAVSSGVEERGAVYTKREVVDFMLDLAGYTVESQLTQMRLLEPSFGSGDFLLPAIDRLLSVAKKNGDLSYSCLQPAIRAVEIHRATYEQVRSTVIERLTCSGLNQNDAIRLSEAWLHQGDFLIEEISGQFTHVIGNPPYVRQENIPDILMTEYRQRYKTIYDRADIYVPFIEKSLNLLEIGGELSFICSDRWMKNKYGEKLRSFISDGYNLKIYVDMVDTDAFHDEVSAYPGIVVIEKSREVTTRVFRRPLLDASFLSRLATELTAKKLPKKSDIREIAKVASGATPWVLDSFDELALARRLEANFPTLEGAGCKVGIGVATGADGAFIGNYEDLDVEPSRKLPLVMTRDILEGHVSWRGKGIVNPFADDGKLVNLEDFPKLRSYLEERKQQISGRHIAEKNPRGWYRTIDRIYPELTNREKLLIPDIKGDASIVYEKGNLYPHHNLYYIVSEEWDIHALQAVMKSGIARLFVSLYCTRMRGGYLRFQAQYLRKIRIPKWSTVTSEMRSRLAKYAETKDKHDLNEIVAELYGLTPDEMNMIEGKN